MLVIFKCALTINYDNLFRIIYLHTKLICMIYSICYADVDECTDNKHGCEHQCVNNDGSFQCECRNGFMLKKDHKHCDGKYYLRLS